MKLPTKPLLWVLQKLFPARDTKCLRCGTELRDGTRLISPCPTCGLRYGTTGSGELLIDVGGWSVHTLEDAEEVAKEQGIELPPWSKP